MSLASGLSAAQVKQYETEGYVVVERMFDRSDLQAVEAAIAELTRRATESPDEGRKILELEPQSAGAPAAQRIFSPYDQHEAFRGIATHPRLVAAINSLIGPDVNLQHSKLNMKPAKVGSVVEWHQDLAYFPHTNDSIVTTLLYLDDATIENGCLQVLPRHHHHFFDHCDAEGNFTGMISENLDDGRFGRPVPLAAPAGSVIFMHCVLPHASLPNTSPHPRRTLIYEYRANDSLPIWYGEMTATAEATYRPICGQPARFARFAGPPPLIPRVGKYSSLYELQARSKKPQAVG